MARSAQTQTLSMALEGDKELQAAIEAIVRDMRDLRPAWDRFYRPHFYSAMSEAFATKQSGTWRSLSADYYDWKKNHGGGSLMVLSGDLSAALSRGTGDGFFHPKPRQMEIGAEAVGPGAWNSPNTPGGRMVIWAASPIMRREIQEAAREHVEWYARKWGHG